MRLSQHARRLLKLWTPPIVVSLGWRVWNAVRSNREYSGTLELKRSGLRWRLDMESAIARSIIRTGVWEPDTTRVVLDCVKPGMHVLSIGANIGYFAMLMARSVGPTGRVWAFEPTKKFRKQLEWNIEANKLASRVTILPFGLSDHAKSAEIEMMAQSASMHFPPNLPRIGTESIELKQLDIVAADLGIEKIDFIQMDIDGHEAAFLRGAKQLLRKHVPPIAMEFSQACLYFAGSDVREVKKLLNELGYEIWSEKTRLPFKDEYEFLLECGNFSRHANAIALRRGAADLC